MPRGRPQGLGQSPAFITLLAEFPLIRSILSYFFTNLPEYASRLSIRTSILLPSEAVIFGHFLPWWPEFLAKPDEASDIMVTYGRYLFAFGQDWSIC